MPIHASLGSPILLGGAPRGLAIVNGTLAAAIGLGLQQWLAGLVLWALGHSLAVFAARRDPDFAPVLPLFTKLEPCLIGIEACGTSHYWARELIALGHQVRLMPPAYVKPYVKRGKTDAGDAEAICEAVTRPTSGGLI